MLRALALILCVLTGLPVLAADPGTAPRPLASALHAMNRGDWDRAAELAARDGPAAVTLIEWHRLRAGKGHFNEVRAFLDAHGGWPGLDLLRRRSEASLDGATDDQIIAFFREVPAQTGTGVLRFAEALMAAGEQGEAQAEIYITGLFAAFEQIETRGVTSRPVPAEFGVEGHFFRYERHFVYWRRLSNGDIGIVTILHERMHQMDRFKEDFG